MNETRRSPTPMRHDASVGDVLLSAVERGFVEPLAEYGFVARGGGGNRGETVECSNGRTRITFSADWHEGELSVSVQRAGESPEMLEDLIDLGEIKALHLTRIKRGGSSGTVEATLRKIAGAIEAQAPHVLAGD